MLFCRTEARSVLLTALRGDRNFLVHEDVAVRIESHRLASVTELGREVGHGDALAQLQRGVAVPEVVGVEVRDARGLTGPGHDVLRNVGTEAGEHSPTGYSIVRRAGRNNLVHEPSRNAGPTAGAGRLSLPDARENQRRIPSRPPIGLTVSN